MKLRKKMYIVKHEVLARNIQEAAKIKCWVVYEVSIADEKYQPQDEKEVKGFSK